MNRRGFFSGTIGGLIGFSFFKWNPIKPVDRDRAKVLEALRMYMDGSISFRTWMKTPQYELLSNFSWLDSLFQGGEFFDVCDVETRRIMYTFSRKEVV